MTIPVHPVGIFSGDPQAVFQAKLAEDLAEEEKRLEAQRLMEQQLREAPFSQDFPRTFLEFFFPYFSQVNIFGIPRRCKKWSDFCEILLYSWFMYAIKVVEVMASPRRLRYSSS